jgi:selenoprotein W-related protein
MASLLNEYEDRIDAITLIPSDGGAFEIAVDGSLIYSKLETGRHPEEGEVARLIRGHL